MGGMPDMSMQPQGQPQMPQIGGDPSQMGGMDPSMMGGDPSQMGGMDPSMMGGIDPSMMGGDPSQMGGQMPNQFDSNFDAGVEADEDEDPENYIKQLTGKLSQKLRSFNKENGQPDESLNKYAAKMIISATAENMSPEGRTELKKAVNTAKGSEDDTEEMSSDGSENPDGGDEMQQGQGQMPIQEVFFTKKNLSEALKNMEGEIQKDNSGKEKNELPNKKKKGLNRNIYSGPKN